MPDPSDNSAPVPTALEESASGKAPEAASGKPVASLPAAEPLSLVPRSRSASALAKDNAAANPPAGGPAGFGDFIHWMKMFAAAMEAAPAAPPAPAKPGAKLQRNALPKEQRKFQRADREPGAVEQATAPAVGLEAAVAAEAPPTTEPAEDEEKSPSAASRPVPIPLTGGTTGGRRAKASSGSRSPYFGLIVQVGAVLLLILSFILGRISVPKLAPVARDAAPAAPAVVAEGNVVDIVTADQAKMIDQAMALEQDHQFTKAADILTRVQKANPQIRDMDFHLALLALESNDAAKALPLLNLSISQGEEPASAYKLRGTILNRRGGVGKGMGDFESSTKLDPFGAENFYFWGEALRKAGKPQAALEKLQLALDRLREPALEAQYRQAIRLTQIDLGQEQVFADEMAAQLAQNPPSPEWLLTAAALELHRNNFAAAASDLEKASLIMDGDIFAVRLRDYFFYSYRYEKALARFYTQRVRSSPLAVAPVPSAAPTATAAPAAGLLPDVSPLLQATPASGASPSLPGNQ